MTKIIMIHDLIADSETGETYKELNAKKNHNIPIGSLVECVDTGIRLFVVCHNRDCDMTPLYSLAADKDDTIRVRQDWENYKWHNGYPEGALRVIDRAGDE